MAGARYQLIRCVLGAVVLCSLALLAAVIAESFGQSIYHSEAMASSNTQFYQDMDAVRGTFTKMKNVRSSLSRAQFIPERVSVNRTSVILNALRPAGNVKGVHTKVKDHGASQVFSALSAIGGLNQSLNSGLPELIDVDYTPVTIRPDMDVIQIQDAVVALSKQRQIICTNWEMYGTLYGGWPVCRAKAVTPRTPCTVYSFGINYEWSFDDTYRDRHGCTIRTFDPTMKKAIDHEHSPGVFFYKLGLSNTQQRPFMLGWNTDTLSGILKHFNEENITIPYLKFDIDGYEWVVLAQLLADGVLKNVVQLSFELHVYFPGQVKNYFELIKGVEALGFRRWFYHHRLNGASYQCDQSFININFLEGYNQRT